LPTSQKYYFAKLNNFSHSFKHLGFFDHFFDHKVSKHVLTITDSSDSSKLI